MLTAIFGTSEKKKTPAGKIGWPPPLTPDAFDHVFSCEGDQ